MTGAANTIFDNGVSGNTSSATTRILLATLTIFTTIWLSMVGSPNRLDWRWSSIHRYVRVGLLSVDWAAVPEEGEFGE